MIDDRQIHCELNRCRTNLNNLVHDSVIQNFNIGMSPLDRFISGWDFEVVQRVELGINDGKVAEQ